MANIANAIRSPVNVAARERMKARFRNAQELARQREVPILTSIQLLVTAPPDWMFLAMNESTQSGIRMFWADETELPYLGVDMVRRVTGHGSNRYSTVADAMREVNALFATGSFPKPRWFGGFSFSNSSCEGAWSGWPEALFFLPKYQFHGDPKATQLDCIVTVEITADTDVDSLIAGIQRELYSLLEISDHANSAMKVTTTLSIDLQSWRDEVAKTAADIRNGRYEKVVLARMSEVTLGETLPIAAALQQLRADYRESFVFALSLGGSCFLGASPERLARSVSTRVSVDCLAGTAPRGSTPSEDEALSTALFHSPKNREEHAVVVRWIRDTLQSLVTDIEISSEPQIKKLSNVQHLFTPLSGDLMPGVTLLNVVSKLHPTPAVAGVPREDALSVILERESFSRGWYASPIGWIDSQGNGDFAVGLRSALVVGDRAFLFAGAGIMGESDPIVEWEETELKMRPIKTALGIKNGRGQTR